MTRPSPERRACSGTIAIVCFGYEPSRTRRQPWAVARGLMEGFAALGRTSVIVTDEQASVPPDPQVVCVERLYERGRPSAALGAEIERLNPTAVFVLTGAWQLARMRDVSWRALTYLVMTAPRLQLRELLAPGLRQVWDERALLALPLWNALLPGWLLRIGYHRSNADSLVYLSRETRSRYHQLGLPRGKALRPQVRQFACAPAAADGTVPIVTYLGPPLEMRGAWLALETFEAVVATGARARLLLLLRPDGDPARMQAMLERVQASPACDLIQCETEMLDRARLDASVAETDVFLLPFRAPVSEVPLVVLEAGLSGRPVVVLAAPGVSAYAEELGGIVAESPRDLPEALAHALRRGRTSPLHPKAWRGWENAVRSLAPTRRRPLDQHRLICLCGVDGSGKSFLLEHLQAELDRRGISHRHVWTRFRNYLSKPLLALTRLTGHNRKVEHDGTRTGYHEFDRYPWLAWPFLALQTLDNLIDMFWRYPRRGLILGDRCVLDTLVDLAVDTGLDDLVISRLGPRLLRQLPSPRLLVIIERPVRLIQQDRPDALADRNFARRRALYGRIAREFGLAVVHNDGSPRRAIHQILARIEGDVPHNRDEASDLRVLQQ